MKRMLAILALVGVVLVVPLTALATNPPDDADQQEHAEADGNYAPPAPELDSGPMIEHDGQGDPDELGGGFRGNGQPPSATGVGAPGFWLDPLIVFLMNLV